MQKRAKLEIGYRATDVVVMHNKRIVARVRSKAEAECFIAGWRENERLTAEYGRQIRAAA